MCLRVSHKKKNGKNYIFCIFKDTEERSRIHGTPSLAKTYTYFGQEKGSRVYAKQIRDQRQYATCLTTAYKDSVLLPPSLLSKAIDTVTQEKGE
jgi:hypothetical protein